jgi:hypothetical protein
MEESTQTPAPAAAPPPQTSLKASRGLSSRYLQSVAETADKPPTEQESTVPAWKKKAATSKNEEPKTTATKATPAWKKSAPARAASPVGTASPARTASPPPPHTSSAQNSFFGSDDKVPAWKKKLNEKKSAVTPKEAAPPKPKPAKPAPRPKSPPAAAAVVEEVDSNMPAWKRKMLEKKAQKEAELAALMG